MTIGVILATFNGEPFLREQLESLRRQTLAPDLLVISDDGSSDRTLSIAEEFARSVPWRVTILRSERPRGPMGNFLAAADACDTDLVAFCDQDDIWAPRKLDLACRTMRAHGSTAVVHSIRHIRQSGARVVEENRSTVPNRLVDGLVFPPNTAFLGMCMVVRKSVLQAGMSLRSLWEPRFDRLVDRRPVILMDHWSHAHDMYALTVARLFGRVSLLDELLADHRLHRNNYSDSHAGWKQSPTVATSWGRDPNVGYRLLAAFCEEFAAMLTANDVLPAARSSAAIAHFDRWNRIWTARAALHAPATTLADRSRYMTAIAACHGYRSRWRGGLGGRSLVRDALKVFGQRVG